MIRDVAAFAEFDNLSLPVLYLHNSKRRVCEVHLTLGPSLEAACPAHCVHEPALVTITVGDAQGVGEAVLERHERLRETGVKGFV